MNDEDDRQNIMHDNKLWQNENNGDIHYSIRGRWQEMQVRRRKLGWNNILFINQTTE